MRTISTTCRWCGLSFTQPDDPGRKREFCGNACRQRAYRARGGGRRPAAAQVTAWMAAYAEQVAAKEKERQRAKARRGHRESVPEGMPRWALPHAGDDRETAKLREVCYLLLAKALRSQDDPELRKLAEALRRGL